MLTLTAQARRLVRPALLSALVLALSAAVPRLDQAAVVPRRDADFVVSLLWRQNVVVELCEPCGDTEPRFATLERAWTRPWEHDTTLWEVVVNDEPRDLAYLYVPLAYGAQAGTFVNVALVAGLPVSDVSPTITVPMEPDPVDE